MDGNSAQAANSSSDFVSVPALRSLVLPANRPRFANYTSKPLLCDRARAPAHNDPHRMLENPQDESVVRWGNEGDSFVVLEVRTQNCAEHGKHHHQKPHSLKLVRRTRNSQNTSCRNTSSTATSPVSRASLTSTISTKCDTTTRKAVLRLTASGYGQSTPICTRRVTDLCRLGSSNILISR